jgi:hypothetical protein
LKVEYNIRRKMNPIDKIRMEKLERTEDTLRSIGCEKCVKCLMFMDKEYLNKDNTCGECR